MHDKILILRCRANMAKTTLVVKTLGTVVNVGHPESLCVTASRPSLLPTDFLAEPFNLSLSLSSHVKSQLKQIISVSSCTFSVLSLYKQERNSIAFRNYLRPAVTFGSDFSTCNICILYNV